MVQVRKAHEGTSVTIKAQHYETGNWWRYGDGHYDGTILSNRGGGWERSWNVRWDHGRIQREGFSAVGAGWVR